MTDTLAIIPARGGSKGIPGKNLRCIDDRSLVAWSVKHALEAEIVDRVIVSTDSEDIRDEALSAGAEVPFMRPDELAGDEVLDFPVFEHAIEWLEQNEAYRPEIIVHLRPTTPYREHGWIDEAVQLLIEKGFFAEQEFYAKLKEVQAQYQSKGR